jgi:hypothetical protein
MLEREEAAKAIQQSRERIAHNVRQMVLDIDHWNRAHPKELPIELDDEGKLAAALKPIGLSLAKLTKEARKTG